MRSFDSFVYIDYAKSEVIIPDARKHLECGTVMPELEKILFSLEDAYNNRCTACTEDDTAEEENQYTKVASYYGVIVGISYDGCGGTFYKCRSYDYKTGNYTYKIVHAKRSGEVCLIESGIAAEINYIYDVVLRWLIPCISNYTMDDKYTTYNFYDHVVRIDKGSLRLWITHEDTPDVVIFEHTKLSSNDHCDVIEAALSIATNLFTKSAEARNAQHGTNKRNGMLIWLNEIPLDHGFHTYDSTQDITAGGIIFDMSGDGSVGQMKFVCHDAITHKIRIDGKVTGKVGYVFDAYYILKLIISLHALGIVENDMNKEEGAE